MILVMKVRCLTVWQMQYFAVMTGIKVILDFTRHRSGLTRLLKMIRKLKKISAKCSKDLARPLSRIR